MMMASPRQEELEAGIAYWQSIVDKMVDGADKSSYQAGIDENKRELAVLQTSSGPTEDEAASLDLAARLADVARRRQAEDAIAEAILPQLTDGQRERVDAGEGIADVADSTVLLATAQKLEAEVTAAILARQAVALTAAADAIPEPAPEPIKPTLLQRIFGGAS